MDHAQLIRDLGGAPVVGTWLRDRGIAVADVTVRSWTHDGRSIPDGYWVHIKAMADEKNVRCTFEELAKSVAKPADKAA